MTAEEKKEYQREWYQKHKEEVKARSKKYFEDHKEEQLAKNKIRYQKNREKILEKQKQYRDTHKEQISETARRYRDNGGYKRHHEKYKEKRNAQYREYYKTHKEELNANHREFMHEYRKTKEGLAMIRIGNYRKEDSKHKRGKCTLTKEWFVKNVFDSRCIYCGDDNYLHLGADRIDNTKPHTSDNCICSCGICNVERQIRKMSVEEFMEYRKTYPRLLKNEPLEEVVEINGIKFIKKRAV